MNKLLTKKAAMFGLDARIALAIFGALSVISGAALYSAIKQAKLVSIVTEMDELYKSYIAYNLDAGSMDVYSDTFLLVERLVDNSNNLKGWSGPYTSIENYNDAREIYLKHRGYRYAMRLAKDSIFGASNSLESCDDIDPCYVWVQILDIDDLLSDELDYFIDKSYDPDNGKLRIRGTNIYYNVGLKV
jgi:hypothetical protein